MFTVLHDNREYVIDHIQSAKINSAVSDIPELSLKVINKTNNPGYPYLVGDAILLVNGHEWRVKPMTAQTHYKNVKATHIAFDLVDMPFNQSLTGTYTPFAILVALFNGTGFEFFLNSENLSETVTVENFGRTSVWAAFKELMQMLGAEFCFLPDRTIQIAKEISVDKNKQFRYAYNVKNLAEKTDTTNVVTHVIVNYGEEYAQSATFISPTASNYKRAVYKTINDSRIETMDAARERAAKEFRDIDLSYEIDCTKTSEKYELGEVVHTIYEPLNDLSVTTRVLKTVYEWDGASQKFVLTAVTVGNFVFKNEGDIIQELIGDKQQESDKKLEEAKKSITIRFEETEEIIQDQYTTITAEYTAQIDISAKELRSEYTAKITTVENDMVTMEQNLSSTISQTAEAIRSEVTELTTVVDEQGVQISSVQSSITQMAGEIELKVSETDYNGNTIATLINQTSTTIKLEASRIEFNGHVFGTESTWSGDIETLSDAHVGNNLYLGQYGAGTKTIRFNDGVAISGDSFYQINISALRTYITDGHVFIGDADAFVTCGGNWDFSDATVSNLSASYATSAGSASYATSAGSASSVGAYSFSHETTGKLTVYRYGTKLGDIDLT